MSISLRALLCAALLTAAFSATADSETPHASQTSDRGSDSAAHKETLQELRARYEESRDRLTGADRLPQQHAQSGQFFDAPVDTRDAPDQTDNQAPR